MRQWPGAVGDKESGSGHGGIPKEGRGGGQEPGAKSQEPADESQEPKGQRREPAPQSVRVQTKGLAEASGEKMKVTKVFFPEISTEPCERKGGAAQAAA